MRVVVVGMGVQGRKRAAVAGEDVVATVDPSVADATVRSLEEVPVDDYDAVILCTPTPTKPMLLARLFDAGKHVLVEKPLLSGEGVTLRDLESRARAAGVVCHTAYNHRFEPHLVALRDAIMSGRLGTIYRARFFYGNGTAQDVRSSPWRDTGSGVLEDLGSHLLDIVHEVFGGLPGELHTWAAHRLENRALDHVVCGTRTVPLLELEMTLHSWRNTFHADVIGEHGSVHVDSLCKWGPSTYTERRRVLPSGRPPEKSVVLTEPDPTWRLEWDHFVDRCAAKEQTDLSRDEQIELHLSALAADAGSLAPDV